MKLTAALSKLKNLKSQLARVDGYVNSSIVFYEGDEPEHIYLEEVANRAKLVLETRKLKGQIMTTNVSTLVELDDKKVNIADLILLNAEARSELAHWTKLLGMKTDDSGIYSSRTKDTIKKVFAEGYDKKEIKARILQLEKVKEQVDGLIAQANMETNLME